MTLAKVRRLSTNELVARFAEVALSQDAAILANANRRYNQLYDRMKEIETELRARGAAARTELLRLYDHPNAQVRLQAAIATLAIAPETARRVLQTISDRNEYPQAADARGIMSGLDDGTFRPT